MIFLNRVRSGLRKAWWYLRQITGDAAYENYLRRSRARKTPHILTQEEFYLDVVRRKYTGINRCC